MIYIHPDQVLERLRAQLHLIIAARPDIPAHDVDMAVDLAMDAFIAAEAAFAGIVLRAPNVPVARTATEMAGRLLEAEIHQLYRGPLAPALTATTPFGPRRRDDAVRWPHDTGGDHG